MKNCILTRIKLYFKKYLRRCKIEDCQAEHNEVHYKCSIRKCTTNYNRHNSRNVVENKLKERGSIFSSKRFESFHQTPLE